MELTDQQRQDINEAGHTTHSTTRPTVSALEVAMHNPIPVLDHGFIRVVDYMGSDASIVQAARVSYGKGTKSTNDDRGLIRYLMRNRHTTPFEMCELKLHVKMPIFVARQWVRHRMASINEVSARYSELDREFYFPDPDVMGIQDTKNRQGRGDAIDQQVAQKTLGDLRSQCDAAYDRYQIFLEDGLSRELARMVLPLNVYTQWYWKIDLHNLFHFLSLRMDTHAQHEIRVYADVIGDLVSKWCPLSWEAFKDFRLEGTSLSRHELAYVRHIAKIAQDHGTVADSVEMVRELSSREREELNKKLGLNP